MSFNVEVLVDSKNIDESKLDDKEILKQGAEVLKRELQTSYFYSDEEETVLDVKVKRLKLERVE